jgi:hypothetical protein
VNPGRPELCYAQDADAFEQRGKPMRSQPIWFGIAAAVVVCVGSARAQEPRDPPAKEKTPGRGDAVLVKGCLNGPTLQSIETSLRDETGHVATPITYQLKGDKKLLKRMRDEHDGKVVEASGILKSDLPRDSAIGGTKVGRTRITFGAGATPTQHGGPALDSALPVLEVKSYESSGARCTG